MKAKYGKVKSKLVKSAGALIAALAIIAISPLTASAHCDTMDGPTVADGEMAMENNNINYALKWVQPNYEKELTEAFELSMNVKDLNSEAEEIAEKYFFGELIRMHRAGEGAPYTGLKPSGTPVDEKVLAADAHSEETAVVTSTEEVKETSSANWIAWTLAGIFFVTTIVSHVKLFKSKK